MRTFKEGEVCFLQLYISSGAGEQRESVAFLSVRSRRPILRRPRSATAFHRRRTSMVPFSRK